MTKHHCDRCGREVKDYHWHWVSYTPTVKSFDTTNIILCPECWRVVAESIKPIKKAQ